MTGFIDQFISNRVAEIPAQNWFMVNTASREGLPNTFIEALASRCAILSSVNTDGLASRLGFNPTKDNFAKGLEHLLKDDRWRKPGVAGYEWSRKRLIYRKLSISTLTFTSSSFRKIDNCGQRDSRRLQIQDAIRTQGSGFADRLPSYARADSGFTSASTARDRRS